MLSKMNHLSGIRADGERTLYVSSMLSFDQLGHHISLCRNLKVQHHWDPIGVIIGKHKARTSPIKRDFAPLYVDGQCSPASFWLIVCFHLTRSNSEVVESEVDGRGGDVNAEESSRIMHPHLQRTVYSQHLAWYSCFV
uniref:Uncharacterized protein n=1 Tax=Opuntia streptacantha TaxID=393608 RepID=A0A7C8ZWP7_OPUST